MTGCMGVLMGAAAEQVASLNECVKSLCVTTGRMKTARETEKKGERKGESEIILDRARGRPLFLEPSPLRAKKHELNDFSRGERGGGARK